MFPVIVLRGKTRETAVCAGGKESLSQFMVWLIPSTLTSCPTATPLLSTTAPLFVSVYNASCCVCKHGDILLSQYNTRTINFISIYYSVRLCPAAADPIMRWASCNQIRDGFQIASCVGPRSRQSKEKRTYSFSMDWTGLALQLHVPGGRHP